MQIDSFLQKHVKDKEMFGIFDKNVYFCTKK